MSAENLKKEVFVILGSPNSDKGELGNIAKSRLDYCLSIYTKGKYVLCTGGWGAHFNATATAHAVYARNYLTQNGISEDAFLKDALSNNSVDDAVKVKESICELSCTHLTVITSDFHKERILFIFNQILKDYDCSFIGVKSDLDQHELDKLNKHEQQAIASILKNGLYY
jgi:vancomycin permeability regulator SanA